MSILRQKHFLSRCLRFISKRKSWFSPLISSAIIVISLFAINGFSLSHRSPSTDHMLDLCMMDHTPCHPLIPQAIDRYFHTLKNQFPMLLTYRPSIDCQHGRYLLLNNVLSSHVYHGTGSQLMWYLGVLNIAYEFNLTLIHLPWTSEHTKDESNLEREIFWHFYDWEIPLSAYQSCPSHSAVKRNIFRYDLLANQTFDQHHQGKQPFTIKTHFKTQFDGFMNNLHRHNQRTNSTHTGFTFYSGRTFTITSSLMEVGAVFEARWWLQHRKIYRENKYDRKDDPLQPLTMSECPSIDVDRDLSIGVHIRHGDVVKRDRQGKIIVADLYRYISSSAYPPLLISIINDLPDEIKDHYFLTIYSEGVISDFKHILDELHTALPESRCRVLLFLNGRTSETFDRMLRDDVFISAHSTFSMATGIFNSRQLKIGPKHNLARVHGMRNHFSLKLNYNHTQFYLTQKDKQLIRQRIDYVWKQKHRQQRSAYPLWLENYNADYSEKFMLI